MTTKLDDGRNSILALLPNDVLASILPNLALVPLEHRQTLIQQDATIDFVYFPWQACCRSSPTSKTVRRSSLVLSGGKACSARARLQMLIPISRVNVQRPGQALRMSAGDIRTATESNGTLEALLLRFNETLHAQVGQTAACNGIHLPEQRLARWLLMAATAVTMISYRLRKSFWLLCSASIVPASR